MDELIHKSRVIDRILQAEGSSFEFDEEAILDEYKSRDENKSSLAIKVLSIFGGIMASQAFIGCLIIAGFYESIYAMLVFGMVFITSSIWLNKVYDKLIIDTFSISLYIIGLILFAGGLALLEFDENIIALLISLIAFITLFVTQNFVLSFIAVLAISGSIMFQIIFNEAYNLIHLFAAVYAAALAYLYLHEAQFMALDKKLSKLYSPLRIGVLISFLIGLIAINIRQLFPSYDDVVWLSSIPISLIVLYLVFRVIKINEITSLKHKTLIYTLTALILLSTALAPSITGALVVILLSFLVNYKTGLVIGIVSIIYFISQFYYDLNFTLLTKSIILFSSGVLFLLFYFFMTKSLHSDEKI